MQQVFLNLCQVGQLLYRIKSGFLEEEYDGLVITLIVRTVILET